MNDTELVHSISAFFTSQFVCAVECGGIGNAPRLLIITTMPVEPKRQQDFLIAYKAIANASSDKIRFVYSEDLQMSLHGYGFVTKAGKIQVEPVGDDLKNLFTTYREPLIGFANQPRLIVGSSEAFSEYTAMARRTVALIALYNFGTMAFTIEDLVDVLIANSAGYLGLSDTLASRASVHKYYVPILARLNEDSILQVVAGKYSVRDKSIFTTLKLKNFEQYQLEQEYFGVHESLHSWEEYMDQISAAGLKAYQNDRPLNYQTPAELESHISKDIPLLGVESMDSLIGEMSDLVNDYSVHQSTVNFMAFPESGNSKGAVAASMLAPLWNQNLISVDKSAPIATFIEAQVIDWLRQLVGYDRVPMVSALNIGGVATTGGVMSNTVGLLVARSLVYSKSRTEGLTGETRRPWLLIADKTLEHYSHKAAFWWLGLGEDNVVPVKSNGYDFDIDDLEGKIAQYNAGNNAVIAVVAMAGDSRTLTIQHIREIHEITQKHNIWLHVDACQGGVALFSSHRDEICADYKLADSISIDPHKGLAVPYSSSFCLFKDQNALQVITKSTDITIAKGSFDIGQVTPFLGSRPFDTLKLWALLKYHGIVGLAKNVDYRIRLTKEWADYLNASKYFIALHEPKLTAVSFSVDHRKIGLKHADSKMLGTINQQLHDRCYQSGWLVIHRFDLIDFENRLGLNELQPMKVLGTNFGNVLLDNNHFQKIVTYMDSQLDQILSEIKEVVQIAS